MTFYLGQKFKGKYPPDAAVWCVKNGATVQALGDGEFEIIKIPESTDEEMKAAKLAEISMCLAVADRLVLDECVQKLKHSDYAMDFVCVAYRDYLRHFTETEGWWKLPVCTWEEWRDAQEKADANLLRLFTQKEEKDANQEG